MIDCDIVKKIWDDFEITLYKIHPLPITNEEKTLGIIHKNPTTGILLRNWLTFLLRQIISIENMCER